MYQNQHVLSTTIYCTGKTLMHHEIEPLIIFFLKNQHFILVRLDTDLKKIITHILKVFKMIFFTTMLFKVNLKEIQLE